MAKIWTIAFFAAKDCLRNRILRILVALAVASTVISIFAAYLFTFDIGKVAVDFGLSTVALTGLIFIFIFGMKILTDDLERHSVYLLMARPVTGWQYICGKFCGLAFILLLLTTVLGSGVALSAKYLLWRLPDMMPPDFAWHIFAISLYFQWLSFAVVLAVGLFWFSFTQQPFLATLLSVFSYFIGQNMDLLRRLLPTEPVDGGLEYHEKIIIGLSWIFPNLSFFDMKTAAAYGLPFTWPHLLLVNFYGLAYIGLLLFFSSLFFNRKELL